MKLVESPTLADRVASRSNLATRSSFGRHRPGQYLDGDVTIEFRVPRPIHLPHLAHADLDSDRMRDGNQEPAAHYGKLHPPPHYAFHEALLERHEHASRNRVVRRMQG